MEWDSDINEWVLSAEAESLIEDTKARHMGLLLPSELHALRLRHGLSQKAIGDLLQIGAKSWTRWETGKQRPSRSINLLLCALNSGLISPQQLGELGSPKRLDWSSQFEEYNKAAASIEVDVIDFYRACQSIQPKSGYADPIKVVL